MSGEEIEEGRVHAEGYAEEALLVEEVIFVVVVEDEVEELVSREIDALRRLVREFIEEVGPSPVVLDRVSGEGSVSWSIRRG